MLQKTHKYLNIYILRLLKSKKVENHNFKPSKMDSCAHTHDSTHVN